MHEHIPFLVEVEVLCGVGFNETIHQLPETVGERTWAWEHTKGRVD